MQKRISNKPTNKPVKPEVKTQAAGNPPIIDWINYNRKIGDPEAKPFTPKEKQVAKAVEAKAYRYQSWADQQQHPKKLSDTRTADASAFFKPEKKMSATRSWQIIRDSMSKDELEEHYKEHPKERPVKLAPVKLDQGLTDMLGDEDWLL